MPFPITTPITGLSSPNCGLFFMEHFSEQFPFSILPPYSLPHIIIIKIMQHNYKHILETQMPAWLSNQCYMLIEISQAKKRKKKEKNVLESLLKEKNEDWGSQQLQKTWPGSMSGS